MRLLENLLIHNQSTILIGQDSRSRRRWLLSELKLEEEQTRVVLFRTPERLNMEIIDVDPQLAQSDEVMLPYLGAQVLKLEEGEDLHQHRDYHNHTDFPNHNLHFSKFQGVGDAQE